MDLADFPLPKMFLNDPRMNYNFNKLSTIQHSDSIEVKCWGNSKLKRD